MSINSGRILEPGTEVELPTMDEVEELRVAVLNLQRRLRRLEGRVLARVGLADDPE